MRAITLTLVLGLFQLAALGQNLKGQAFLISATLNQATCEVEAYCDCCGSDLIFNNEREFALISYCLNEDSYFTGTYSISNGKLTLTFKQLVAKEIVEEGTDVERSVKEVVKIKPMTFKILSCGKGKSVFENPTSKDLKYGSRRDENKVLEIMNKLKESKAYQLIRF